MAISLRIVSAFDGTGGYCFREIDHDANVIIACGQSHPQISDAELEAENYYGHVRWKRQLGVNGVHRFALYGQDY